MKTMTTRELATLAGIPESISDEALFKFCDLYQKFRDAEYARMNVTDIRENHKDLQSEMKQLQLAVSEINKRYGAVTTYIDSKEEPGFFNAHVKAHMANLRQPNKRRKGK